MDIKNIGIYRQERPSYSEKKPYFPPAIFEEYPFNDRSTDQNNYAYSSIRNLLKLLELDSENFGKKSWNPFGSFMKPGDTVLLKPNLVRHFCENGDTKGLMTHGSLIRAAADYAYIALQGKGRIIIADGPMDDADFEKIASMSGIYEIREFYKGETGFDIEIYDLRQEMVVKKHEKIEERVKLAGDPLGYSAVNLGPMSAFKKGDLDYASFRGSECRPDIMSLHHNKEKDEYLISNTFLNADVVINIPKMKTHKRAGVTLSLKNLVGITGDRNWLPHYSENVSCSKVPPRRWPIGHLRGGIEVVKNAIGFIKPLRDSLRQFTGVTVSTMRSGNWHGNDIIWRTILDLWRIALYADKNGIMRNEEQRKTFVIVDGIIGGEADGPTNPTAKRCGVLVAGFHWPSVDIAVSRIMGFDPIKIPKFKGFSHLADIPCVSNIREWDNKISGFKGMCLNFKPHYGWKKHIEADTDVKKQDL
ncbi:MAG: DUF362 domain-containing protein [Candidatus Omnitrophota bacterium]